MYGINSQAYVANDSHQGELFAKFRWMEETARQRSILNSRLKSKLFALTSVYPISV